MEHGFLLSSMLQNNPDLISQIVVAQVQVLGLTNDASTTPHLAKVEHLFDDAKQNKPLVESH